MIVAGGKGTRMPGTVKLQLLCDHIVELADALFGIACFGKEFAELVAGAQGARVWAEDAFLVGDNGLQLPDRSCSIAD